MQEQSTTKYKFASAHEWLREYLVRESDIHKLRELAYQFAQKRMDGDDIQELFEKEMDADGFFTPEGEDGHDDEPPDLDDSVHCCPECETPNQFGELCDRCRREIQAEGVDYPNAD